MLDVSTTAGKLIAAGYLEIKSGDFPALINIAPEVAMPVAPVETKEISIELLEKARCIMIESTRAHIGLLGNDMIRRISLAKNAVQIKSCIAEWHMALRGSRQGREVANQQLNQVNVALGLPTENTWIE